MKKLIAIGMLLLSGCAAQQFMSIDGTGTQQQFYQAKYACMQRSQPQGGVAAQGSQNFVVGVVGAFVVAQSINSNINYRACMAAAGWIVQPQQ